MESKTTSAKEQIIQCEDRLLKAIKDGDVNALDEMLHEDLLFITPDGQTITKAMDLEAHRSGNMTVEEISSDIELINLIDSSAIVTVLIRTKGTMMGQPIEGSFRYIRMWRLSGNSWKVIGGSCTKV